MDPTRSLSSDQSESAFENRFYFVDDLSKNDRVTLGLRESHRKKRWTRVHAYRNRRSPQYEWQQKADVPRLSNESPNDRLLANKHQPNQKTALSPPVQPARNLTSRSQANGDNDLPSPNKDHTLRRVLPGPPKESPASQALLSSEGTESFGEAENEAENVFLQTLGLRSARQTSIDPFAMFPMKMDHYGQSCFHKFITLSPEITWHVNPNSPFNPFRDIFVPLSARDPGTMFQVLTYSSHYSDLMAGRPDSQKTISYQIAAVQAMRQTIQSSSKQAKMNTLAAVTAALVAEFVRHGSSPGARAHSLGISQILRSIGGFSALKGDYILDQQVTWVQVFCSKSRIGLWEHGPPPGLEGAFTHEVQDFRHDCDHFIEMMHAFRLWAKQLRNPHSRFNSPTTSDKKEAERATLSMQQAETFGRGKFLRLILEAPTLLSGGSPWPHMRGHEEMHWLFCRLYFAYTMWVYRDEPAVASRFIDTLNSRILSDAITGSYTLTPLVWVLMRDPDGVPSRKWFVTQMLHVIYRLRAESRTTVMRFFMGLLDPASMNDDILSEMDVELFLDDILLDLPMPAYAPSSKASSDHASPVSGFIFSDRASSAGDLCLSGLEMESFGSEIISFKEV